MTDYRKQMAKVMLQTVTDQQQYGNAHYLAVRPQEIPGVYVKGQEWVADCADGCRCIARWAAVPDDPAGNKYASYGNSSSIWAHLPHAPLTEVEVGDIFTFGYSTGEHHACMAYDVSNPADPEVWNMGTQGQPVFRKLSNEIAGHAGMTVTLCKIQLPTPTPPVALHGADKLRAETGFYSWLAWRLGEGAFRPYGAANKTVRPAVPRVIPAGWWKRYAVFMANRKKPNPATSKL